MYKPIDPRLLDKVRNVASQYDDALLKLARTSSDHRDWQELDRFPYVKTNKKASSMMQALRTRWGGTAACTGYTFRTIRDGDDELLLIRYSAEEVIEGALEAWEQLLIDRKAVNAAKQRERAEEARIKAQQFVEQLDSTDSTKE